MRGGSSQRRALLGASALGALLLVQVLPAAPSLGLTGTATSQPMQATGASPAPSAGGGPSAARPPGGEAVERDEVYRETLRVAERFGAVWRQQPDNRPALERYLAEIRDDVAVLCGGGQPGRAERTAPPPPAAGAGRITAAEATAGAPSGPVQPSQRPSSDADIRARIEATLGTFHTRELPGDRGALSQRTLAGVPDVWIANACALAVRELDDLGRSLTVDPVDRTAVERSLARLRGVLDQMSTPPPGIGPTAPQGGG